jgi:hypothetical protein
MESAIVEPTIAQDILMMEKVRKLALLRFSGGASVATRLIL